MRKVELATGEIYHIYNRGTDKRNIFSQPVDLGRFLQSVREFNNVEPIGSLYLNNFFQTSKSKKPKKLESLVKIIGFCLNPNHYHLILEQMVDNGISKFMQKLGTGYTNYFNAKHERTGVLFQGKFKSAHIIDDETLLRLSVYVNLNHQLHQLRSRTSQYPKLTKSSWELYVGTVKTNYSWCQPNEVLRQFKNKAEYKKFAEDLFPILLEQKERERKLSD